MKKFLFPVDSIVFDGVDESDNIHFLPKGKTLISCEEFPVEKTYSTIELFEQDNLSRKKGLKIHKVFYEKKDGKHIFYFWHFQFIIKYVCSSFYEESK